MNNYLEEQKNKKRARKLLTDQDFAENWSDSVQVRTKNIVFYILSLYHPNQNSNMNINYFIFSHLYFFNRKPVLKAVWTINIKFANND